MKNTISYIVSAFDRPEMLRCCLASLRAQTVAKAQMQIIVTDNSIDNQGNETVARLYGAEFIRTKAESCYHAIEMVIGRARNEYVCFPSDDSYYVPSFTEKMLSAAVSNEWDLVYCNMLYELHRLGREYGYKELVVEPRWTWIDKTGFLLRRTKFKEFPFKGMDGLVPAPANTCGSDGYLIEQLVREGISHGKVYECLVVHN